MQWISEDDIRDWEVIYKAEARGNYQAKTYKITLVYGALRRVLYWPFARFSEVERAVDRLHLPVSSWVTWEAVKDVTYGTNPESSLFKVRGR
jgi:hypothetical protein